MDGGYAIVHDGLKAARRFRIEDFAIHECIGDGSFSQVFKATYKADDSIVALKKLSKINLIKHKMEHTVYMERDIMMKYKHPFIMNLYGNFQDEESLYFIIELCLVDLSKFIQKPLHIEYVRFYAAEIVEAVAHLHSKGVIHRDLKPENIFIGANGHIRIGDFGSATWKASGDSSAAKSSRRFVGTPLYIAPEIIRNEQATEQSDWWAVGLVIFFLLTGRPLFTGQTQFLLFQHIVKAEYTFPPGFDETAKDLLSKLIVLNQAERLNDGTIMRHPFFAGLQWGALHLTTPPLKGAASAIAHPSALHQTRNVPQTATHSQQRTLHGAADSRSSWRQGAEQKEYPPHQPMGREQPTNRASSDVLAASSPPPASGTPTPSEKRDPLSYKSNSNTASQPFGEDEQGAAGSASSSANAFSSQRNLDGQQDPSPAPEPASSSAFDTSGGEKSSSKWGDRRQLRSSVRRRIISEGFFPQIPRKHQAASEARSPYASPNSPPSAALSANIPRAVSTSGSSPLDGKPLQSIAEVIQGGSVVPTARSMILPNVRDAPSEEPACDTRSAAESASSAVEFGEQPFEADSKASPQTIHLNPQTQVSFHQSIAKAHAVATHPHSNLSASSPGPSINQISTESSSSLPATGATPNNIGIAPSSSPIASSSSSSSSPSSVQSNGITVPPLWSKSMQIPATDAGSHLSTTSHSANLSQPLPAASNHPLIPALQFDTLPQTAPDEPVLPSLLPSPSLKLLPQISKPRKVHQMHPPHGPKHLLGESEETSLSHSLSDDEKKQSDQKEKNGQLPPRGGSGESKGRREGREGKERGDSEDLKKIASADITKLDESEELNTERFTVSKASGEEEDGVLSAVSEETLTEELVSTPVTNGQQGVSSPGEHTAEELRPHPSPFSPRHPNGPQHPAEHSKSLGDLDTRRLQAVERNFKERELSVDEAELLRRSSPTRHSPRMIQPSSEFSGDAGDERGDKREAEVEAEADANTEAEAEAEAPQSQSSRNERRRGHEHLSEERSRYEGRRSSESNHSNGQSDSTSAEPVDTEDDTETVTLTEEDRDTLSASKKYVSNSPRVSSNEAGDTSDTSSATTQVADPSLIARSLPPSTSPSPVSERNQNSQTHNAYPSTLQALPAGLLPVSGAFMPYTHGAPGSGQSHSSTEEGEEGSKKAGEGNGDSMLKSGEDLTASGRMEGEDGADGAESKESGEIGDDEDSESTLSKSAFSIDSAWLPALVTPLSQQTSSAQNKPRSPFHLAIDASPQQMTKERMKEQQRKLKRQRKRMEQVQRIVNVALHVPDDELVQRINQILFPSFSSNEQMISSI